MKAEGQARPELPRNLGYMSKIIYTCVTGYGVHAGRGDDTGQYITERHRDGTRSLFTACTLPCLLVAALHP